MAHLNLPEIDLTATSVTVPPTTGHWHESEPRLLGAVADGIVVDVQAQIRGVSSVPDVWARPLMFASALALGARHPLRARMIQEWRGLLSLLALREVHGYPVEIVPVGLDGGSFSRALRALAPRPYKLERERAYDWSDIVVVRYDGVPVGAFSPATLVYTAAGYQHQLRGRQFNLRDDRGFLTPPTDRQDLHSIAEWLSVLLGSLETALYTDQANPDHLTCGAIVEQVKAWLGEIRRTLNLAENDEIDARDVRVSEDYRDHGPQAWPPLEGYRVYQALLRPLVDENVEEGGVLWDRSSLFMAAARAPRSAEVPEGVVVIHERLLTEQAKVWGPKRLSSLGGDARAAIAANFDDAAGFGTAIAGQNLAKSNSVWVRPERYFLTDTLVRPAGGRSFALAEAERAANAGGRYVLPFRRRVLDFFSPDDVAQKLRPEMVEAEGGAVRFAFTLPLRDGTEVRVEKTYRAKNAGSGEGTIREEALPVIDVFPNWLPGWRRYYLFQSDADRLTAHPVAPSAAIAVADRADEANGVQRRARVVELHGADAFPEAVELAAQGHSAPLGLVLLRRPLDESAGLADSWKVGVDFGTSNTNVYLQREDDPLEPLVADFPRHLRPLTDTDPDVRDALLQAFFVPNRAVTFPVPTFLDVLSPDLESGRLLLHYFLHFPAGYRWPARVRTNIKWDTEDGGGRVTEYFLEGLLFLILLEATARRIRTLRLRCSYPKAFTDNEQTVFEGEWNRTVEGLARDPDVALIDPSLSPQLVLTVVGPEYYSEGLAAGSFFASPQTVSNAYDRANTGRAVCLDVGGGTTDISIWYGNRIVVDASLRLAGAQIASYVRTQPALQQLFLSPDAATALQESGSNTNLFGARLNLALRQEERALRTAMNRSAGKAEVARVRQLIAFEFGAIAFYAAALVGAADRQGAPGILKAIAEGGIKLHWGGNAAKLITWIDYGEHRPDGLAAKMLNGLFYQALKDMEVGVNPATLAQVQSPAHKAEAAGGLPVLDTFAPARRAVSEFDLDEPSGDGAAAAIGVVTGENVTVAGREVGFLDGLPAGALFADGQTLFEKTSLVRLERFVDVFNRFGVKFDLFKENRRIEIDEVIRANIRDKVRNRFVTDNDRSPDRRVVEPVFILEVRELMDLLISRP